MQSEATPGRIWKQCAYRGAGNASLLEKGNVGLVTSGDFRTRLGSLVGRQTRETKSTRTAKIDVEDKDERIHLPRRMNVDMSQTINRKENKVNEER